MANLTYSYLILPTYRNPFATAAHNLADVYAATSPCHAVDSRTPPFRTHCGLLPPAYMPLSVPIQLSAEGTVIGYLTNALLITHSTQTITDQLPDYSAPRGARQTSRFTPARASPYPANEIAAPLIQLHGRVSPHTPISFSWQPSTHRNWPTWLQQLHPLPPHQAIYTLSSGLSSPLTAPPPSVSM